MNDILHEVKYGGVIPILHVVVMDIKYEKQLLWIQRVHGNDIYYWVYQWPVQTPIITFKIRQGPGFESHLRPVEFFAGSMVFPLDNWIPTLTSVPCAPII